MAPNNRIVAVLGPTNTGKTHYAIERMLGHRTGIMGLPLRLLARISFRAYICWNACLYTWTFTHKWFGYVNKSNES